MNVIQIMGGLSYGDGMSNCLLYIKRLLDACGIPNTAVVTYKDPRIDSSGIVTMDHILDYGFADDDLVLYHYGTGDKLNALVERIPCRKLLIFQNVTPPKFFREWDYDFYRTCSAGYRDMKYTAGKYVHAITPSAFSKQVLIECGWKANDISIFPLYELSNIGKPYDKGTFEKFSDSGTNILFTGRIVPHKKIEDIISIFDYYNRNYDGKSRLILVGGGSPENYRDALDSYIADRGIKNVVFTGHISDEERNAIYKIADVFLCMSEHEGFCLPILEAFQREVPVVAYKATAIPDTMGDAGVLVETKDPNFVCREIDRLMHDGMYRQEIVRKQLNRLSEMTLSAHRDEFVQLLQHIEKMPNNCRDSMPRTFLKSRYPKAGKPVSSLLADISSSVLTTSLPPSLKNKPQPKDVEEIIAEIVFGAGINEISTAKERIRNSLKKEIKRELISSPFSRLGRDMLVLYGIGKIGKSVFNEVLEESGCNLVAVCDNACLDKIYNGIPVYTHEECIRKYPSAKYLITVQKGYLKVFENLRAGGISGHNIYFYDNIRRRIELGC